MNKQVIAIAEIMRLFIQAPSFINIKKATNIPFILTGKGVAVMRKFPLTIKTIETDPSPFQRNRGTLGYWYLLSVPISQKAPVVHHLVLLVSQQPR